jgi:phosphoribosylanthranilate isomerase
VTFTLLPAVDVADGLAVRLVQGEAGTETNYGDPLDAALAWQRDGAEWVHLVDLDAAFGRGSNRELLARVVGELDVQVELSGGIRDDASLAAALATGCARVNLGTAALEDPVWCAKVVAEHGEKIAVGLDVRITEQGHRVAARGWTKDGGDLWEVLERLDRDGCARYVVTDVGKDGTLQGPNVDLLREVARAPPRRSSPRAACPVWTTWSRWRRCPATASRARSWARRSTRARSRSRRRWPRSAADRVLDLADDVGLRGGLGDARAFEGLGRGAFLLGEQAEQQVLGADERVALAQRSPHGQFLQCAVNGCGSGRCRTVPSSSLSTAIRVVPSDASSLAMVLAARPPDSSSRPSRRCSVPMRSLNRAWWRASTTTRRARSV